MQEVKCRIEGDLFIAEGELISDLAGRLVPEGTTVGPATTTLGITEQGSIKFSVRAAVVRPVKDEAQAAEATAEAAMAAPQSPATAAEPAAPAEPAQEGSQS